MGQVIQLSKYLISRSVTVYADGELMTPLDAEIEKCRQDQIKHGVCHMIGGKRVSPLDFGRKK